MLKVIICQGLPASGKSTWSKKFCEENPTYVRVCRDDLRHMRGRYMIPRQEKLITLMEHSAISSALKLGYNVVVDATNLKAEYRIAIEEIALSYNAQISFQSFLHVTPEECIERDLKRPNSVGAEVIMGFYDRYVRPKVEVIKDRGLRRAVICDLDGTLCIHNGRTPYEEDKCDTDLVNTVVRDILWQITGLHSHLIFVSGRQDNVKDKTSKWIKENVPGRDFELFMRKAGDRRNDAIVKKEIFMEHINGKFFIDFVLDDRDRVVEMWRKDLGLVCLQVDYGNF